MTKVSYQLANGTIVSSYEEALSDGMSFKVLYDEDNQRELNPYVPTEDEVLKAERRFSKLIEKYPCLA